MHFSKLRASLTRTRYGHFPKHPHRQTCYGVRPKEPGMYLGLFHGRERPEAVMAGWGFDGPVMGPLEFFHTTYANTIHLKFENVDDAELITGKKRGVSKTINDYSKR